MSRGGMSKRVGSIAAILGAFSGLAGLGYYWLFQRPLPKAKGRLALAGLEAPVDILRDRWGVPHIYAQSSGDLFFAQGFVHAQERLWQMDFHRRLVAGRLSEILGAVSLPLDRWMRTLGLQRAAAAQQNTVDALSRQVLESYAAGVNTQIQSASRKSSLPVEFLLLHYQPEPWTVLDSLGWAKMMAWNLSVNWETEILRARLIARLGPEKAAELEPLDFEQGPRVIPPGIDYSCIRGEATLRRTAEVQKFTGPTARNGLGSNNWVISPALSETGMPLLANDMHLGLTAPAIWFENHLAGGGFNVSGVSFPGVPGIIAGHNEHVAWGFTNGFPDVQDLYVERLRRTETGRVQYLYQGQWEEAQVIHERIRVKGGPEVTEEVILTRHGPIINSLAPDFTEAPLALRWTALEPDTMVRALVEMNRAGDCLEFREALRHWAVPIQNTVYADTQGNIGYSFPGKVPIRKKGDGRVPIPGWTDEYEWVGYIPYEELPHLINPPQGYIVTANNRVVGDDYPYFLGYDHVSSNRARRITEMIAEKEKISPADIRRMQVDQVSPAARGIVAALQDLHTDDPHLATVLRRLQAWDGVLSPQSMEAAVYEIFVPRLIRSLLDRPLGDELAACYAGKGVTPGLSELSLLGERSREWLHKILAEPGCPWFDLGDGCTREEILLDVLQESIDVLKRQLGEAPDGWAWGRLHRLTFNHPLGSVKPLNRLFNRGPYPIGGDFDTVWASGSSLYDINSHQIIGPPFRFIADLSDWNRSLGIVVPGQSGHPGSRHYADNIQPWFRGEYHPMLFDRAEVEKNTVARLVLEPRPGK